MRLFVRPSFVVRLALLAVALGVLLGLWLF